MSEQMRKRIGNRSLLLEALHFHGPLRRTELSRQCKVRKSSVTSILEELLDLGIVVQETPGRARTRVALDTARFHVAAAWVSGHTVRVGRVFLDGRTALTATAGFARDAEPEAVLDLLCKKLGSILDNKDVLGVGVATPGLVDTNQGVGLYAVNLRKWRDVQVREILAARLGHRILVDNEIRCGLWASLWFERLLVEHRDILHLVLSEGVGGALFVRDALIRGSRFAAGEFGHIRAGDEKRPCVCGKLDCLETYASLPAMLREIRALYPALSELANADDIARAAAVEPIVQNVLDRSMARLAWVVAAVAAAFDPSLILLGGQAEAFCETVRPLLEKHLRVELGAMSAGDVTVGVASGGANAPLQGVAGLVIEDAFRREDIIGQN